MAVVAIAAAVGAISAFSGARSRNKARKKQKRAVKERERDALAQLSPEAVTGATKKFQPLFREMIAGGEGPLLKQSTASSLARHGLTGTGVGEAIRGLSATAPDAEAFRRALEKGYNTQLSIADTINQRPIPDYMRDNPYMSAISGAAQGAFGAGLGGAPTGASNMMGVAAAPPQTDYYDVFRRTGAM